MLHPYSGRVRLGVRTLLRIGCGREKTRRDSWRVAAGSCKAMAAAVSDAWRFHGLRCIGGGVLLPEVGASLWLRRLLLSRLNLAISPGDLIGLWPVSFLMRRSPG